MALCAFLHPRFRWWTVLGTFLLALLLFSHHNKLVNRPGLIGRWSTRLRVEESRTVLGREMVLSIAQRLDRKDAEVYPAGWLDEEPFLRRRGNALRSDAFTVDRIQVAPLWHSFLSGIYRLEHIPLRPWYPGGTLAEAADHIEFREQS